MKNLFLSILCIGFLGMVSCDVDQTREGEMPEVDVDVEEGQLPAYDVDWADVDISTTTKTVKVPKVTVTMVEKEVEVPVIDVNMPDDGEKEERTLIVEAEVAETAHDLEIVEVYAAENRLYVISELTPTDQDLQDETVRVSDRVVVNAPEDLDVRYYIVGSKPVGDHNNQYNYIQSRSSIADKLKNGKKIYSS
ncbi:hypothetical protein [Flavilitoribacter nigricans]|uniref:Uncharacterized protein n=1 Tax=Flavilitoribacter nigricans (strain ATCC 23147 / DSM 23189 / NBRC 102662 / NCIMB 1420 / SS-2) TaxID=1122177 RepID=A0A2D0NFL7_FLAN2|nr:hypothetical protein [Flavilitoribacter nigricans]PHN07294.1 hypothetical protein CRP01_06595 [Flavilitoribacter nigricans DSM 23189 = NBRC 102662]